MTIGKLVKEHSNTSGVCSYRMYEIHSTTRKELRYTIKKYIDNKMDKQIVMPVSYKTAKAVWAELEANDWKS